MVVGEKLLQTASDEEIIGVVGHEVGHVLKRHLFIKGLSTLLFITAFLVVVAAAGESRPALILSTTVLFALLLAAVP